MNKHTMISLALGAAMLGGSLVTMTSGSGAIAAAAVDPEARQAAKAAAQAEKALTKHRGDAAVRFAERAVAFQPGNARYRALLGQAYLGVGRFTSAAQAYSDALAIDPANGNAALNLALAQTALGDWATARATLDSHAAHISPGDRGLALALAGDPAGGVAILSEAARDPAATATVRQNLALALALSGKWVEAKAVASVDVSPADVDKRIMEWAAFARPTAAADQVAALLGVVPVADGGQPVELALAPPSQAVAVAVLETAPETARDTAMDSSVALAVSPEPAAIALATSGATPMVTFAPRREIVQPIAVAVAQSGTGKIRVAVPAPVRVAALRSVPQGKPAGLAKGNYFVQLGAFENSGVARDAWSRVARGVPQLAGLTPAGAHASVRGASYYRLSVGGFARGDADRLCGAVRGRGGRCFVRTHAGDAVAAWARGTQVASR